MARAVGRCRASSKQRAASREQQAESSKQEAASREQQAGSCCKCCVAYAYVITLAVVLPGVSAAALLPQRRAVHRDRRVRHEVGQLERLDEVRVPDQSLQGHSSKLCRVSAGLELW